MAAQAPQEPEANQIKAKALANVSDPLMASYVSRAIGPTVLSLGQAVSEESFNRESSMRRGQLDGNLLNYATAAASAPNPEAAAHFTDLAHQAIEGAKAASWIMPEEGDQRRMQFDSTVAKAKVEQLMLHDPSQAASVLADPTARAQMFPGLLPQDADAMALRADNRAYRMEMRANAAQMHADAMAERNLRQAQQGNEGVLVGMVLKGQPVDDGQLADLELHGQIGTGAAATIMALRDRRDAGRDDPNVLLTSYQRLNDGTLTPDAIHAAVGAHTMKAETGVKLLQGIAAKSNREESPLDRANFNALRTAFSAQAVESGVFGKPDAAPEAALWTQVQQQWVRRVFVEKEDSSAVQQDLIKRLSPTVEQPIMGPVKSLDDLTAVAAKTFTAHQTGQMDDATYQAQVARLNRLRVTLGAGSTPKPAAPAPPQQPGLFGRLFGGSAPASPAAPPPTSSGSND